MWNSRMPTRQRLLAYIFLTVLVEGALMYGIFALSTDLDLNYRTNVRYVIRQCLYYLAYNVGYVLVFPFGMGYGGNLSGMLAWAIGCVGMFIVICLLGEAITRKRTR